MKTLASSLATSLMTLALCVAAQATHAAELTVTINNAKSDSGKLMLALYDSAGNFMKPDQQIAAQMSAASTKPCVFVFHNLNAGRYAISAFHDENSNGKLDTNMLGMPSESYGFSNNAVGNFGPPDFEQAAVTVKGDTSISIDLH